MKLSWKSDNLCLVCNFYTYSINQLDCLPPLCVYYFICKIRENADDEYVTRKYFSTVAVLLIIIVMTKALSQNVPSAIEFCTRSLTRQRHEE